MRPTLFVVLLAGCTKQSPPPPVEIKAVPAEKASSVVSTAASPATSAAPAIDPSKCTRVDLGDPRASPACISATGHFESLAQGVKAEMLEVTLIPAATRVKAGAPVGFTVEYINKTDRPIAVGFGNGPGGSRRRGRSLFLYAVVDKRGSRSDEPPGTSPCCGTADNPTINCSDVPVVNEGYEPYVLRVLLAPGGAAVFKTAWIPKRKKWGPKASYCEPVEIGPLAAGEHTLSVELPSHDNIEGMPTKLEARLRIE